MYRIFAGLCIFLFAGSLSNAFTLNVPTKIFSFVSTDISWTRTNSDPAVWSLHFTEIDGSDPETLSNGLNTADLTGILAISLHREGNNFLLKAVDPTDPSAVFATSKPFSVVPQEDATPPSSPSSQPTNANSRKTSLQIAPIIGGVIGAVCVIAIIIVTFLIVRRSRKKARLSDSEHMHDVKEIMKEYPSQTSVWSGTHIRDLPGNTSDDPSPDEMPRSIFTPSTVGSSPYSYSHFMSENSLSPSSSFGSSNLLLRPRTSSLSAASRPIRSNLAPSISSPQLGPVNPATPIPIPIPILIPTPTPRSEQQIQLQRRVDDLQEQINTLQRSMESSNSDDGYAPAIIESLRVQIDILHSQEELSWMFTSTSEPLPDNAAEGH